VKLLRQDVAVSKAGYYKKFTDAFIRALKAEPPLPTDYHSGGRADTRSRLTIPRGLRARTGVAQQSALKT
jgi:hypothetical protein